MKVAVTQMDIAWEDKKKNMEKSAELVKTAAAKHAELIVFPEMTLTGFTMNTADMGESRQQGVASEGADTDIGCRFSHREGDDTDIGCSDAHREEACTETEAYFAALSAEHDIAIAFGYILLEGETAKNMLAVAQNGEIILRYAKIHPFSYGNENKYYTGGNTIEHAVLHTKDGEDVSLGGFICYDLRFPEVFQISAAKSELILVIANWPAKRAEQWTALLKARAIETQCYIAGVNRTGGRADATDDESLVYIPGSAVFDPMGNRLTEAAASEELLFADIDTELLHRYREDFPVRSDRREDLYEKLRKHGK